MVISVQKVTSLYGADQVTWKFLFMRSLKIGWRKTSWNWKFAWIAIESLTSRVFFAGDSVDRCAHDSLQQLCNLVVPLIHTPAQPALCLGFCANRLCRINSRRNSGWTNCPKIWKDLNHRNYPNNTSCCRHNCYSSLWGLKILWTIHWR